MYGYYGYGFYDPTMFLVLIGAVLSLWASAKVKNTFNRYSSVRSMTGMTGAEAAQRLLNSQGIYDVTVRPVSGQLTDHYDPRTKTVNLSDGVIEDVRITFGVAAPVPYRCVKTEEALKGMKIAEDLYEKTAELVREEINPRDSWRASKAFRLQIGGEIAARALRRTIELAGGDSV